MKKKKQNCGFFSFKPTNKKYNKINGLKNIPKPVQKVKKFKINNKKPVAIEA